MSTSGSVNILVGTPCVVTLGTSGSPRERDNRCTFELSGTFGGLVAVIEASSDGTIWDTVAAFRQVDATYEQIIAPAVGFSCPDSTNRAWSVDCTNRNSVRFRVISLGSGAPACRGDASFFPTSLPVSQRSVASDQAGNSPSFNETSFSSPSRTVPPVPTLGAGIGTGPNMVIGENGGVELERVRWNALLAEVRRSNKFLACIAKQLYVDAGVEEPDEEIEEDIEAVLEATDASDD